MAGKTRRANKRIAMGGFTTPSPAEVQKIKAPTAAQFAEWGIAWPPEGGWKKRLKAQWLRANPQAVQSPSSDRSENGTFGPAGPAVSLVTGKVYPVDGRPEIGTEGSPIFLRNCGPRNTNNLPPPWC